MPEIAWSFSRVKNFEACPRKYHEVTVLKAFSDRTEQSLHGDAVHRAIADYIQSGKALPVGMETYRTRVDEIRCALSVAPPRREYVEQQIAITRDGRRCGWFANEVWFRAIADYIGIYPESPAVAQVADWKTGNAKEDDLQLRLNALAVFLAKPELERIHSHFVWLKEGWSSTVTVDRAECAAAFVDAWPRVQALQAAHVANEFPPRPSGLCKRWCPVNTCSHHGG